MSERKPYLGQQHELSLPSGNSIFELVPLSTFAKFDERTVFTCSLFSYYIIVIPLNNVRM
ncbi:hypothetical protein DRW41_07405 [Neobacillus piezotolerans]|uniref:Uncharacterized protein n=1 Tax=Neobacillus piezotolerans TaxID=2259171 RepID=A0A3D8GT66_9BACI|nr:hypothetical protein DRW41_07405 [Neobacillus piezotolerans]